MILSNDDPKVLARVNVKRPNTTCSLMANHRMDCDDCKDMVSIDYQNMRYTCAKEFLTHRFKNLMKQTGRNIEIRWSNNYLTEKPIDDNDEPTNGLDTVVGKETEGEPLGVPCEADQPRVAETTQYETKDVVGDCWGGD